LTTNWPYPSSYPTALDDFTTALIDNVDEVIANHPNSLASAVMALQQKVNLDNEPIQNVGGVQFDPIGRASNPASPGDPCVWVDNSGGPGFDLKYTDDAGTTITLGIGIATLTGSGNPNGSVSGVLGQHYWDTANFIMYANEDGATAWRVV